VQFQRKPFVDDGLASFSSLCTIGQFAILTLHEVKPQQTNMKAAGSIGSALALPATSAAVGVWSCRPVVSDQPAEAAQQAAPSANVAAHHDCAVVAQMLDRFVAHEMADATVPDHESAISPDHRPARDEMSHV